MRLLTLVFTLLFSPIFSYAGNPSLADSLINILPSLQNAEEKAAALNKICLSMVYSNPDSALIFGMKALELGKEENNDGIKGKAYNHIGIVHDVINEWDKALLYYDTALICGEEANDSITIASVHNNIGLIYWNKSHYDKAANEFFKSLKIFEAICMQKGVANNYNNIGLIFMEQERDSAAIQYHQKALKIRKEINDSYGINDSRLNLGTLYFSIKNYDSSLYYYHKALIFYQEKNYHYALGNAYNGLGMIYEDLKMFDSAFHYYDKAINEHLKVQNNYKAASSLLNKASVFRQMNNQDKELTTLIKGYELVKDQTYSKVRSKLLFQLAELYYKKGKYKKAADLYMEFKPIKDSLFNKERAEIIEELKVRYETEKKEQENLRLAKENELKELKLITEKKNKQNLLYLFGIGGVFSIIFFLLIFNRYRLKKQTEVERRIGEQKTLGYKAVIEAEEKERIRIAKDLHDGIGQLLSTARVNIAALQGDVAKEDEILLKNSLDVLDESIKEVRNISHNMMPVALIEFGLIKAVEVLVARINEANALIIDFQHQGVKESRIEQSTEISLYRIIQEVINNMLKHSEAAKIIIELKKTGNIILLKIQDDGKGFNLDDIDKSKGIGWKNIYSRISMINGNMDIKSNPNIGTIINIDFTI